MNALPDILRSWARCRDAKTNCVLVTLVGVHGSAYRQPGARMLLAADGRRFGTISGGCLEAQVCEEAWRLTESGPAVVAYDTRSDDDVLWGYAMGCKGVITLLLERLDAGSAEEPAHLSFLRRCINDRRSGVIATVTAAEADSNVVVGDRLMIGEDTTTGPLAGSRRNDALCRDARDALRDQRPAVRVYGTPGTSIEVFFEYVRPPTRLIVFGAGDDAIPLVNAAAALSWPVTVVDRREGMTTAARFPRADRLLVGTADALGAPIEIDAATAVVVMTHHFPSDVAAARLALRSPASYIGILGPRPRTRAILAEAGAASSADDPRLFGPTGLDVGAETPEEVAVSIVAEIKAHLSARRGGPLRDRTLEIHDRAAGESAAPKAPVESTACGREG